MRGLLVAGALLVSMPAAAIVAPKTAATNAQFQVSKARIDKGEAFQRPPQRVIASP